MQETSFKILYNLLCLGFPLPTSKTNRITATKPPEVCRICSYGQQLESIIRKKEILLRRKALLYITFRKIVMINILKLKTGCFMFTTLSFLLMIKSNSIFQNYKNLKPCWLVGRQTYAHAQIHTCERRNFQSSSDTETLIN